MNKILNEIPNDKLKETDTYDLGVKTFSVDNLRKGDYILN